MKLTARIESENPAHTTIRVFQDGGSAGLLTVETKCAEELIGRLTGEKLVAEARSIQDNEVNTALNMKLAAAEGALLNCGESHRKASADLLTLRDTVSPESDSVEHSIEMARKTRQQLAVAEAKLEAIVSARVLWSVECEREDGDCAVIDGLYADMIHAIDDAAREG